MHFAGKAAASADKVRGGYYTPQPAARFLAHWVREAGPRIVEPSCGDGAILRELSALSDRVRGVELIAEEAAKARQFAPVDAESLFTWLAGAEPGGCDGVAGNPPYIRFGNWAPDQRDPALELMRREGLRPSRLTNAWVPFVVASAALVRDGGRVGLVLPAELLQVGYAAPLREFLLGRFSEITLVTFERLVFDGVLQEVVLFCGVAGPGPARMRTVHLADADALAGADLEVDSAPALLHEKEKWTKYFLDPAAIRLLRALKASPAMTRLGSVADVDVGIVTGRNSFFTFTDAQAGELALRPHCVRAARSCPGWFTTATAGQGISPRGTGRGCSTRRPSRPTPPWSPTSAPARPPACTAATSARSARRGGSPRRCGCPTCSCCARSTECRG
jgi:adenine-specific DNA methylase